MHVIWVLLDPGTQTVFATPLGSGTDLCARLQHPAEYLYRTKVPNVIFLVITFKRYNLNTGQVEHSKSTEGTVKRFPFLLKPHLLSTHFGLVDNWLIAMRGKGKCLTLDL